MQALSTCADIAHVAVYYIALSLVYVVRELLIKLLFVIINSPSHFNLTYHDRKRRVGWRGFARLMIDCSILSVRESLLVSVRTLELDDL